MLKSWRIGRVFLVGVGVLLGCGMGTGFRETTGLAANLPGSPPVLHGATTPANPHAPAASHHAPGINPHLHLPPWTGVKGAAPGHVPAEARVHRAWHPSIDVRTYIAVNRGLGTVRGMVHNSAGQPIAGSRVALHKAGGAIFRNVAYKHITYTAANGEFVMTNVRPGAYRVYAYIDNDRKKGFSPLTVGGGRTERVKVKI